MKAKVTGSQYVLVEYAEDNYYAMFGAHVYQWYPAHF